MDSLQQLAKTHFNLDVSNEAAEKFGLYMTELREWSTRINLTSITDPDEITIKHFLDSLSVLTLPNLPEQARIIDVGTGAGLPGLALKIIRPQWQVILLEATGKKVDFLNHVIQTLKLENAAAVKMRAEEAGQDTDHRAKYDLVVARAVARMPILMEYLLPLCKVGGLCVAMKGETAQTETADAAYALQILGGEVETIAEITLPEIEQKHYLACVRKVKKTPNEYPRRAGIPSKSPLVK